MTVTEKMIDLWVEWIARALLIAAGGYFFTVGTGVLVGLFVGNAMRTARWVLS